MKNEIKPPQVNLFESIRQIDENGNEFWMARQLSKVLKYADFRNFQTVIEKAQKECINNGQVMVNHIVELTEMVSIRSGAIRKMQSYKFACLLILCLNLQRCILILYGITICDTI